MIQSERRCRSQTWRHWNELPGRPHITEVRADGRRIAANEYANQNHSQQSTQLRRSENVLHNLKPDRMPCALLHVSNTIRKTPTNCAVESETAYPLEI